MNTVKMYIKGFSPLDEIMEQLIHAGWPVGTPLWVKGDTGHVWFFIVTKNGIRKPTDLESYLFRGV